MKCVNQSVCERAVMWLALKKVTFTAAHAHTLNSTSTAISVTLYVLHIEASILLIIIHIS